MRIIILTFLFIISCTNHKIKPIEHFLAPQKHNKVSLLKNNSFKINLLFKKTANFIDHNWLGFEFINTSKDTIFIEEFSYGFKGIKVDSCGEFIGWQNLASGNKYGILPFYEDKLDDSSQYENYLLSMQEAFGYREATNYSTIMLGHDKDLSIKANLRIKGKVRVGKFPIVFQHDTTSFRFTWKKMDSKDNRKLADRLKNSLDSIKVMGNGWIALSLMKDNRIARLLSDSYYVNVIKKRRKNTIEYTRLILSHLSQKGRNRKLIKHYIESMPTADWSLLQELYHFWDDSFLYPLVDSFEKINKHHYKYMQVFDKNYASWKGNKIIQSRLYKIIKKYGRNVLVSNENLTDKNKDSWLSWIKKLQKTHSYEAIQYFYPFLKNEKYLYPNCGKPIEFRANIKRMKYDVAMRVCDVALESILYAEGKNIESEYKKVLSYLIEKKQLTPLEKNCNSLIKAPTANQNLMIEDNMLFIRDEMVRNRLMLTDKSF